jgi:hypothetical protein
MQESAGKWSLLFSKWTHSVDVRLPNLCTIASSQQSSHFASTPHNIILIRIIIVTAYLFYRFFSATSLLSLIMTTFPVGNNRIYLRPDTSIELVHELEHVPKQRPLRNDSITDELSEDEVARWETLFGFTPAEARYELLAHRSPAQPSSKITQPTLDQWTWERCEAAGFDRESYDYWLKIADDFDIWDPKETVSIVRHMSG